MAGAIMNKVWDLFGMDTERDAEEVEEKTYDNNDYDTYDGYDEEENDEIEDRRIFGKRSKEKVVSMPQTQQIKMVISQPTTFDQSEEICEFLKEKKSVIVNLEYVNKDVARRIIDVVSGAITVTPAAKDGIVATDTYILSPTATNGSLTWETSTSSGCKTNDLC